MKNCPNCDHKPMSLWVWGIQLNPFRIRCKHCSHPLTAEGSIYAGFVALLLMMPLCVYLGARLFGIDVLEERYWLVALLLTPAIVGGPVVYWLGGYKLAGANKGLKH